MKHSKKKKPQQRSSIQITMMMMNKLLLDFGSTWCHQGSWIHLHFILAKWEEIRVGPLQSSSPKPSKLSEHETKNQTWKSHIYVAFRVIICSRLNSLRHQGKYCIKKKIQNDKLEKYFGGKQFEKAFIPFPFHPLSSRGSLSSGSLVTKELLSWITHAKWDNSGIGWI